MLTWRLPHKYPGMTPRLLSSGVKWWLLVCLVASHLLQYLRSGVAGVYLKVLVGSHQEMDRLRMHFKRVRPDWMMDGVKTEEGWLPGPLADGGAIIRDEQIGRRTGFYP